MSRQEYKYWDPMIGIPIPDWVLEGSEKEVWEERENGAQFSNNRVYRYKLWRIWNNKLPLVLFIGLNPSTANEVEDDPTVRRCVNFAKRWEYGGIYMGNLFAVRATDPKEMVAHNRPIGPDNDHALREMILRTRINVACWGTKGLHLDRGRFVSRLMLFPKCFGITKTGHPKHPLYLRNDTELIDWPRY